MSSRPKLRDIFRNYNRIVNHHAYGENQSSERYDIYGYPEQIKQKECHNHSHNDRKTDNQRQPHATHEQRANQKNKYQTQYKILTEIADREIKKFSLVSGLYNLYIGILAGKIIYGTVYRLIEVSHPCLLMFDHCHCDSTLPVEKRIPLRFAFNKTHLTEIPERMHPAVFHQRHMLYILRRTQTVGYMYVVFVISVPDGHTARFRIILIQSVFDLIDCYTRRTHLVVIRGNAQLFTRDTRNINHRNFGKLLQSSAYNIVRHIIK